MQSIVIVFLITVIFLLGMTKFTNDTAYNEALRYAELSEYYQNLPTSSNYYDDEFLSSEKLTISFSGEVKSTKTFEVVYGSYLSEALEKAGGVKTNADSRCYDPDFILTESISFYIPGGKLQTKISLNEGTKEELMSLQGIGSVSADKIIEYRNQNGRIYYLEEIMKINGIGKSAYNYNRDYLML